MFPTRPHGAILGGGILSFPRDEGILSPLGGPQPPGEGCGPGLWYPPNPGLEHRASLLAVQMYFLLQRCFSTYYFSGSIGNCVPIWNIYGITIVVAFIIV